MSARENRTPQRPCDAHARSEVVLVDSEANSTSGSSKTAAVVSATRAGLVPDFVAQSNGPRADRSTGARVMILVHELGVEGASVLARIWRI